MSSRFRYRDKEALLSIISEKPKWPRWFEIFNKTTDHLMEVIAFAALWISCSIFLIIRIWLISGRHPKSELVWIVAIIVLPILWVAGRIFVWYFRRFKPIKALRDSIDKKTEGKSISATRVFYLFIECLALLGIFWGVWWAISSVFF